MSEHNEAVRQMRRIVPPLGWPVNFRAVTVTPADRQRRLVILNRYPRQVIGISIRLPDDITQNRRNPNTGERFGHHRALSIVWAKPVRWWKPMTVPKWHRRPVIHPLACPVRSRWLRRRNHQPFWREDPVAQMLDIAQYGCPRCGRAAVEERDAATSPTQPRSDGAS